MSDAEFAELLKASDSDPLALARCFVAMYGDDPAKAGVDDEFAAAPVALAVHVIAQAEELAKLQAIAWQCPRCGRADLQAQHAVEHRQSCMSRTDDEQRIDELESELAKLREQFAASAEVREAITIAEALDENERIRDVVTELVTKLEKGATISAGLCSWCRERWLHPSDATPDDVRELSRVHAYRCKLSPLKLERDALQAEVAQLRAALTEALDAWHGWVPRATSPAMARIAELRRLADGE